MFSGKDKCFLRIGAKKDAIILVALLCMQVLQVLYIVHRESLTFDEGDHMYAGYRMLKAGDYGLNPEHPPLVKMLAALPLAGRDLWDPPATNRYFKDEAYGNGFAWWARNDGARQQMTLAMRLSVGVLALCLTLLVYAIARSWFGARAALWTVVLLVFEPNVLAHSALVTTDMGVTLFFLASIFAFWRWMQRPTILRLLLVGLAVGLLLATKHSGILIAPMLALLAVWELLLTPRGERIRRALRLVGGAAVVTAVGVLVLWSFYGFRYSSRPLGMPMSVTLSDYAAPLGHFSRSVVIFCGNRHLLPESYLIGLVDVKRMAEFYGTYLLGQVHANGVWWYFPLVILIKTTLGMLALCVLTLLLMARRTLKQARHLAYLFLPGGVYLLVAMLAGMNIGARHILLLFAMATILAGAGAAALTEGGWKRNPMAWGAGFLVLAHVASSLTVFPVPMAYANEAWGGPKQVHRLLSDSNVDWAQQLIQVRAWQDRHPHEECWFAYFANPEIDPVAYGIHCHKMPTIDTLWLGGSDLIAPKVSGAVLISAGDLSGGEWPSAWMNPYRSFESEPITEQIDYGVMVYQGSFSVPQAAALSRAIEAWRLQKAGRLEESLAMARDAVAIDPVEVISQTARGDIARAMGKKDEARAAWMAAIASARRMEPDAQVSYIPDLETKLKQL